MTARRICLLGASLALAALSALAGDDALEIVTKLQDKYKSINDVSVSFTQDVLFGVSRAEQSTKGTLAMRHGNNYRIDTDQQTIVTDGTSVWSYNKANNQVFVDKYKDDPNSFSAEKVLVNIPETYTSTILGTEKIAGTETTVLKLIPKKRTSNLQWMKIWVDRDEWLMKKVQVLDASENLWTYDVTAMRLNPGLPDTVFHFTAPPGAELIDLR